MNAYDRSLISETLGQEKVSDPSSPFFDIVPIPPKLDYQCDMVGIKWQNTLAELLMKVLWKKLLKKSRDDWLEVFLVVFVMLNNVEFVYGIGKELSEQYSQHAVSWNYILEAKSVKMCANILSRKMALEFNRLYQHT
jgi:hypothetical protein